MKHDNYLAEQGTEDSQSTPESSAIDMCMRMIAPERILETICIPIERIRYSWPPSAPMRRGYDDCMRILAKYYWYFSRHWVSVSRGMTVKMASHLVWIIMLSKGDHIRFLLNEAYKPMSGSGIDRLIDAVTEYECDKAVKQYIAYHVYKAVDPYDFESVKPLIDEYVHFYRDSFPQEVVENPTEFLFSADRLIDNHSNMIKVMLQFRSL
jgi:hypothetical protein